MNCRLTFNLIWLFSLDVVPDTDTTDDVEEDADESDEDKNFIFVDWV